MQRLTQELFRLDWPSETQVTAADRSAEMIQAIWPGTAEQAVLCDWCDLPFPAQHFDMIVNDGGLHLQNYPAGHWRFVRSVYRVLKPGGHFVIRLFARPEHPDPPESVIQDFREHQIANFHALKLRLAMALNRSPDQGVRVQSVYEYMMVELGSLQDIATYAGWPIADVETVLSYRDSDDTYHFLTERESIAALTEGGEMELLGRRTGSYPLGERCPVLGFRRRNG